MICRIKKTGLILCFLSGLILVYISGCALAQADTNGAGQTEVEAGNGSAQVDSEEKTTQTGDEQAQNGVSNDTTSESADSNMSVMASESADDAQIDFAALQEENPDIFAWLQIPGTSIDCPVLQSGQADDYYETHNAYGEVDTNGAAYIELANLTNMSDFNTVIHGKTGTDENGLFADLYRFANPNFFENHEYAYVYLDGNVLTYEIFAAYDREDTSLIRTYDFTYFSGCKDFLDDLYGNRNMSINIREGWKSVSPYNYVITLTTKREESDDKQFVVIAVLINDAAGTIDRLVTE